MAELYEYVYPGVQVFESDEKTLDDLYEKLFHVYFEEIANLYHRMKSNVHPITDEELSYIITTLPLELFAAAENLNKIRLDYELLKIEHKENSAAIRVSYKAFADEHGMSKADRNEFVTDNISIAMSGVEKDIAIYRTLIDRVERECSFARELIMGAKKIFDSRRAAESASPILPNIDDIPEYKSQQYIK